MTEIVVIVKGGMVQEIKGADENVRVIVHDLDAEKVEMGTEEEL